MAQLVKTWTFDSTLENWVTSGVVSRVTTDGDPGVGCLEGLISGRNASGIGQAQWSGNYMDLGIAFDAVVNGISLKLKRKVDYWYTVNYGHWTVGSTLGTLINQQNESGTTAWAEIVGNTISGLNLDPSTSLTLTLSCDLDNGNDKTAGITFRWDTIELTIDYTPNFLPPQVTTNTETNLGSTTATLNGSLASLGDATSVDVYFEWREVGAPAWNTTTKQTVSVTGPFSANLSNLNKEISHEFRACVDYIPEATIVTLTGTTLTFSTLAFADPTVVTNVVDSIGPTTATLNGELTSLGDATTVDVSFEYRLIGTGDDWDSTLPQTKTVIGTFNAQITFLSQYMEYEFRTLVSFDQLGTPIILYGSTLTFKTSIENGTILYKQSDDYYRRIFPHPFSTAPLSIVHGVAYSFDGKWFGSAGQMGSYDYDPVRLYRIEDENTYTLIVPDVRATQYAYSIDFSDDDTYIAAGLDGSPYIIIYKIVGDTFTKLPDPLVLPAGIGRGTSFSHDSTYLAVAHEESPFITIYKRDGDTFTKLPDPLVLPTGQSYAVKFSLYSTHLAIAHATAPYVTIYKRDGDTFTKLPDPLVLPAGTGYGVSFSHDSTYMAVAHWGSPFITIYKRDGDTFTKLPDPVGDIVAPAYGWSVDFSSDSRYLAMSHATNPSLIVYRREGDVFTSTYDPATFPGELGRAVAFSKSTSRPRQLALGHGKSPYVYLYEAEFPTEEIIVEGSSYTDNDALSHNRTYTYGADVYINGVLQTDMVLSAELNLKDVPASIKLTWGEGL